jgi:hypothetical protein
MCIVTGLNQDIAIKLIKRMKGHFEPFIVFLAYKQLSKYKLVEDKTKPPAEEEKK